MEPVTTEILFSAGIIFLARLADMSLDTLRIFYSVRGKMVLSSVAGFLEAFIFIFALAQILRPPMHLVQMLGYGGGFAAGTFIGTFIAKQLATEFVFLRTVSRENYEKVTRRLRKRNVSVSTQNADDEEGSFPILYSVVRRKDADRVLKIIQKADPGAFVTFESIERAVGTSSIPTFMNGKRVSVRR